jgi:hypothetical protein
MCVLPCMFLLSCLALNPKPTLTLDYWVLVISISVILSCVWGCSVPSDKLLIMCLIVWFSPALCRVIRFAMLVEFTYAALWLDYLKFAMLIYSCADPLSCLPNDESDKFKG